MGTAAAPQLPDSRDVPPPARPGTATGAEGEYVRGFARAFAFAVAGAAAAFFIASMTDRWDSVSRAKVGSWTRVGAIGFVVAPVVLTVWDGRARRTPRERGTVLALVLAAACGLVLSVVANNFLKF